MRVYFLTEDSKSFFYVLPHWLKYMLPNLREASGMSDFREDSFLVETGGGYPQILRFLQDTIRSFQENESPPDYFIVCYDTDDADEQQVQHDGNVCFVLSPSQCELSVFHLTNATLF